jgi:quinol-cytochrome oxidoreductase complex cytochrome b subunit
MLPANLKEELCPVADQNTTHRMRQKFILHLHPLQVTERACGLWLTFGLGIITATLFLLLTVTGVLLMFYYIPTTTEAYPSIQDIQYAVSFGAFMRALHRYAAHGMVATVALHLVRIVATGAYRRRALNWLFGLLLLALTLGLAFTGYLLPWDQLSYWAVSVATNLLDHVPVIGALLRDMLVGGPQVAQPTLLRFYVLHVALLPIAVLLLVALHLWRIRKDGGLASEPGHTLPTLPAWPHLVVREALVVMGVIAVFFVLASVVDAPLGAPADPHHPGDLERAPWYFLWLQEMVSYSAPVGGFVFPGCLVLGLLLLPFFDREDQGTGLWFGTQAGRRTAAVTFFAATVLFVLFEYLKIRQVGAAPVVPNSWLQDLINPATGMLVLSFVATMVAGGLTGSSRNACLAGFLVLAVALVGFTLVGLCRGPGWEFYWPWEGWPGVS